MNVNEHRFLSSQQATLKKLLSETDESEVIVRMSLDARLREVESQLEAYEERSPRVIDARLTFDGKPVIDNDGIMADFFAKALASFEIAVASVGASLDGLLGETGPIPNRSAYEFLITGIARGSFGFEFRGASQHTESMLEYSQAELAVETVKDILEASMISADENELFDEVGDIHQRALKHLCEFLNIMAKNEAVCTLRFGEDVVRFNDMEQVKRSAERLGHIDNAENIELAGQFLGILPNSRRAEFLVESTGEVITGPVRARAARFVQRNTNRFVKVSARRRQTGTAKPRYTFLDIRDW